MFTPLLLIASAGLAVAQSISSQCVSTIGIVSSAAPCLDLAGLTSVVLSNSTSSSVIPQLNSWLTDVCGQPSCSNATLQAAVTNITNGCSSDLASLGLTTTDSSALASEATSLYPLIRQVACLEDTATDQLCPVELLTDIQSATTTLTLNNLVGLVTSLIDGANFTLPQNVTCSACSQAMYSLVNDAFPGVLEGEQSTLQAECGANFTDGQIPPSIVETASNATTTTKTGGAASLSISSLNSGAAMLIAVSSAFALFA